nr:uncharacterized protein LOC117993834 [Maniola hyperantus]
MTVKSTQTNSNKSVSLKHLLKLFVTNIKKNTQALKALKCSFENKSSSRKENYEQIFEIANSVNEKLEIVQKLRSDIKIYKTINTILTNHYIKLTRDHESSIDAKIINIENQILHTYENLRCDISKMADACVARDKHSNYISAPVQNIFMVGNDFKSNQFSELCIRNQMYNSIIHKIDDLFVGLVSSTSL